MKLTREEEEELLSEWKPEPLVSDVDPDHDALHVPIIDHKVRSVLRTGLELLISFDTSIILTSE